jgi:hypothetical protein
MNNINDVIMSLIEMYHNDQFPTLSITELDILQQMGTIASYHSQDKKGSNDPVNNKKENK